MLFFVIKDLNDWFLNLLEPNKVWKWIKYIKYFLFPEADMKSFHSHGELESKVVARSKLQSLKIKPNPPMFRSDHNSISPRDYSF
jgi:hypothetical protein